MKMQKTNTFSKKIKPYKARGGIILISLILLYTLVLPLISAELNTKKYFTEPTKDYSYGYIDINTCNGFWEGLFCSVGLSKGTTKAKFILDSYDASVIDFYAQGKVTLYEDSLSPFKDVKFYNIWGNNNYVYGYQIYIQKTKLEEYIYYENVLLKTPICKLGNKSEEICQYYEIQKKTGFREVKYFDKYKGEKLPAGQYVWRLEGRRKPNEKIDFVLVEGLSGKELKEWAWFDTDFRKKKNIQIEPFSIDYTNYQYQLNITKETDMNRDYSDIRFTNGAEDTELDYYIVNYSLGYAIVDVEIPSITTGANTSIYMYYKNNTPVSTTSSGADTYIYFEDFESRTVGLATPLIKSDWRGNTTYGVGVNDSSTYTAYQGNKYFYSNDVNSGLPVISIYPIPSLNSGGRWSFYYRRISGGSGSLWILDSVSGGGNRFVTHTNFDNSQWTNYQIKANTSHYKSSRGFGTESALTGLSSSGTLGALQIGSISAPTVQMQYDIISFSNSTLDSHVYTIGAEEEYSLNTVTSNRPNDNYYTSSNDVIFNCTSESATNHVLNLSLRIDNVIQETVYNTTSDQLLLSLQRTETLTEGTYTWNCTGAFGNSIENSSTRTLYIDTTEPVITGNITPVDTFAWGDNVTLNYGITDTNINQCWYSYNSANTTINCAGTSVEVTTSEPYKTINLWANDSAGNSNNLSLDINYKIIENSQNYTSPISEGTSGYFDINLTLGSGYSITSTRFVYDGTQYTNLITSGNYVILYKNFEIPSVTANSNKTFNWSITLDDSSKINSSSNTLQVNNLVIDNCSTSSFILYNFTLKDEEDQTILSRADVSSLIEVDLNFYSSGNTLIESYYSKYDNVSSAHICLNNSLGTTTYLMSGVVSYTTENYTSEFYNFQKTSITNSSFNTNTSLYSLKDDDSTAFIITYKDSSFIAQEDVLVIIQRKYVSEGVFKTVEIPITDMNGKAIGHFDTDGVIYTIILTKNGVILDTFDNIAVICQNPLYSECNINLNSLSSTSRVLNYNTYDNLIYNISFSSATKTATALFSTIDGTPTNMLINGTQFKAGATINLCSDTLYGSSGTLSCVIPASYGNISVLIELYKDDELITQQIYSITPEPEDYFGYDGYVFVLILVITLPLMFTPSYIGVVFGIIIGLIAGSVFMLFSGGSLFGGASIIIWGIIAGGILVWKANQSGGI